MKTKYAIFGLLLIAVLAASCFGPWDNEKGNLTLVWGNNRASRTFVAHEDLRNFYYEITLTGPGGTIKMECDGLLAETISVAPGTWTVTVKGYERVGTLNLRRFKLMGIEQVRVAAGRNSSKTIPVYTAAEICSWEDLGDKIRENSDGYYANNPRTELFVIKNSFYFSSNDEAILINRPIILIAEDQVTIGRENQTNAFTYLPFFEICNSHLTLGINGMAGTLTIDNEGYQSYSLIEILADGSPSTLVMNKGVTIKGANVTRGEGGGVYVGLGGTFINNGGTFVNNMPRDVYRQPQEPGEQENVIAECYRNYYPDTMRGNVFNAIDTPKTVTLTENSIHYDSGSIVDLYTTGGDSFRGQNGDSGSWDYLYDKNGYKIGVILYVQNTDAHIKIVYYYLGAKAGAFFNSNDFDITDNDGYNWDSVSCSGSGRTKAIAQDYLGNNGSVILTGDIDGANGSLELTESALILTIIGPVTNTITISDIWSGQGINFYNDRNHGKWAYLYTGTTKIGVILYVETGGQVGGITKSIYYYLGNSATDFFRDDAPNFSISGSSEGIATIYTGKGEGMIQ